jgi:hypothetical protein
MNNVSLADLNLLQIRLAPVAGQRRVVVNLDAVLARVDACTSDWRRPRNCSPGGPRAGEGGVDPAGRDAQKPPEWGSCEAHL